MGSSFCYRMLQTIIGFSMQICDAQLPTDGICYVLLKIVGVISMLMLRCTGTAKVVVVIK